jgi:hypothetical protein
VSAENAPDGSNGLSEPTAYPLKPTTRSYDIRMASARSADDLRHLERILPLIMSMEHMSEDSFADIATVTLSDGLKIHRSHNDWLTTFEIHLPLQSWAS